MSEDPHDYYAQHYPADMDEDQERYYKTGRYPDSWVHENNNWGRTVPSSGDDASRPIWGQDMLGNKVLVGYERLEQEQPYYYATSVPTTSPAPSWTLYLMLLIGAALFVVLFVAAQGLQAFGQSSGIAPTVNEWLGFSLP